MFSDAPHVFRRGCSSCHAEIWTQRFCRREAGFCSSAAPGEGAADGAFAVYSDAEAIARDITAGTVRDVWAVLRSRRGG